MPSLEKISTIDDMKILMNELCRLKAKFIFDFYGVFQDFSSKKFLPQWLQKKSVNTVFVSDKGTDVLLKVCNSSRQSIVIYDLETPDLNGLQFLAELGKKPDVAAKCKLILACPKLTLEVQNKVLHMGTSALVSKPLSEEDLQRAFEKVGLDY